MSYDPITGKWDAISTEAEFARARQFTSIYNDELKRLYDTYGEKNVGKISLEQINKDCGKQNSIKNSDIHVDYTI